MAEGSGEKLTALIFGAVKIFIALFILKIVLTVVGFTGYIPLGDEVYAFVMKAIMILGTGRGIIPTRF